METTTETTTPDLADRWMEGVAEYARRKTVERNTRAEFAERRRHGLAARRRTKLGHTCYEADVADCMACFIAFDSAAQRREDV